MPGYPFLFELKDRADKEDRVIRLNAHGPQRDRTPRARAAWLPLYVR